jgi:hypothetical protein
MNWLIWIDLNMNRPEHNNINFFTGTEVEHTPAHGKKTLFVVGVQSIDAIKHILIDNNELLDQSRHIDHIYFGANMSFPKIDVNNGGEWAKWETMIYHFLDLGYWCTLDVDISCVEGLCDSGLCENSRFIPMISAKLPYIGQLGYNATLKLDDKDFKATNPGVWCHSIHSLMDRDNFTDWSKYTKDQPL